MFSSEDEEIVCGLLLTSPFQYLLFSYGLLKFGNVILFPMSPGNSYAAVEHLLKETKSKYVLTTNPHLTMLKQIQQTNSFVGTGFLNTPKISGKLLVINHIDTLYTL